MKLNLSKTFLLIASLAFFNGANADTTCVQDTDSSGATGYFVNDGTKTYNGRNGTDVKRCGMSRKDQGSQQFKVTAAPPAGATPGSASPTLVTTPDPSTPNQIFQPNISFQVPSVINGAQAVVTLYSGSSAANLTAGPSSTVTPNSTYTSPNLTSGQYYSVHVQYRNAAGTPGRDSIVISPFKFDPCNGAPICNAKMTYTNTVSSSTWFHKLNQRTSASAADPATPTTATVSFIGVHTGTDYDVCVGISNASTIFAKTRVTATGPYTMTGTFTGNVLGYLGCQGAGCTVRLIKDASCGSATPGTKSTAVGAAWNSLPQTYLGSILP